MSADARRRRGRGDIARHAGEQCVAAKTIKVRRRLGRGMQYRVRGGARCRLVGRIPTEYGRICSSHHVNGFIPFVEAPAAKVSDAIALRMRAVLEEACAR